LPKKARRTLSRADRAFRRNRHRERAPVNIVGFVANSSDDAVRELVECFYAALDRRDWSTVEALVSPRVVVEVGSSEPFGWDAWRANLEEFTRGFPDGHHVIEEVLVDGSHGISRCRFTGTHTGEFHGVAPTGVKVSIAGIHIDRFQGDTLVAHRGQLDLHGLLEQLKRG
jgi:predicted ester cyclase